VGAAARLLLLLQATHAACVLVWLCVALSVKGQVAAQRPYCAFCTFGYRMSVEIKYKNVFRHDRLCVMHVHMSQRVTLGDLFCLAGCSGLISRKLL
jgi:hypothetical protein